MKLRWSLLGLLLLAALPTGHVRPAAQEVKDAEVIPLRECLVLPSVGQHTRSPVHTDAIEAQMVAGTFKQPKAGDEVARPDGSQAEWTSAKAGEDGWLTDGKLAGGYAYWRVESSVERVAMLNARGHTMVYVNGEPRYGDPYDYGYVRAPFILNKGVNEFLFFLGRGRVNAQIDAVATGIKLIIGDDWTLPDYRQSSSGLALLGSVNVFNVTREAQTVWPRASVGTASATTDSQVVPPLAVSKVWFALAVPPFAAVGTLKGQLSVTHGKEAAACAPKDFEMQVVESRQPFKKAFLSDIDDSVQYCAMRVAPPQPYTGQAGTLVTLHGASVEAIGHARAYDSAGPLHIVAPTNRRPYGFDWEDWGRLDALEVMKLAGSSLLSDPARVYLSGHSMGGHGTWSLGSMFPDKFAAIGPSAGWESFWSYAGGATHPGELPVSDVLTRAANPYRTLLRKHNYRQQGVYILHGDADDNVPVTEARAMRDALRDFHPGIEYFEQPGAGHWWDDGHDDGADCVDWGPMREMFLRRRIPATAEAGTVDFTTTCPEHSADCHWARIELQQKQLAPSRVQITLQRGRRVFVGTTENVARMSILVQDILAKDAEVAIRLDGAELTAPWPESGRIHLRRDQSGWKVGDAPDRALKGPHRYGLIKDGFNQKFVYVYGTKGSADQTAANYAKARFDLEQWWYRANGSFPIITDREYLRGPYSGRNVILVGNAENNEAWDNLLRDCPVRVSNGKVSVGDREVKGDDLSLLFRYPMGGSRTNSVVVVSGTGLSGTKLTHRLSYFVSGAAFPDLILYSPDMLQSATGGVLAAGFFGEDWGISSGEFVWRDKERKD